MLKTRLLILAFIAIFIAGCVSQEQIAQNFQARRVASYQRLISEVAEPNDVESLPVLQGQLSLARSLDLADQHNQALAVQRARLLQAEGQMIEAVSTAMPKASLSGSALANDNEAYKLGDSYQWRLLARQPLYLGGLSRAAVDAAAVFSYMVGQETRQVRQQVQLNVRRLYLATLLAAELENVSQQALLDATESLRLVEARYNLGEVLRFELLRSQVRVRSIQANIIRRHNDYVVSLASLLNELGVSQLSSATLSDELLYDEIVVDRQACIRLAMLNRPDLLIGESLVRLAQDNILSEQSGNRPKIYLQGLYQEDKPGSGSINPGGGGSDWQRTMNGGLVMEWPFFNGRETEGRVVQARAELHSQQSLLAQNEQAVQLQTTQALLNLESAKEFVASQRGNVTDAEEALRLARVNFREGANTSLDVITEESALARARSDYVQSVHDYQLAKLQLAASAGILGERDMTVLGLNTESTEN